MDDPQGHEGRNLTRSALQDLESARGRAAAALEADPATSGAFGELLTRLRLSDSRRGTPNAKPLIKALGAAREEVRWLLALRGPGNGVARGIMEHLEHFGLGEEQRFLAALACVEAEPEKTLELLDHAQLTALPSLLAIVLVALSQQPVLDFEEQKKIEILYLAGDATEGADLRRRYDQARSQQSAHARRHQLRWVPPALRQDPAAYFTVLQAMLRRDPYGALECLRDPAEPHPFQVLPLERRLDLLDLVAACGLGLASNYLDLFELPEDPSILERLKAIFRADLTAGSSIFGVYALEGIQNYPFGLHKIEPDLPRRISNAEALAFLKGDVPDSAFGRVYSPTEIGNAMTLLQEREVERFLERLQADIFLEWKAGFSETKRAVVFGDKDLKIRNVLFLVAHALFADNAVFDQLLGTLGSSHPSTVNNPAQLHLLANRYFFLEILGLNPGLLFNNPLRSAGALKAPIEEVKNFRVLYLLHVAMSIYLQVGDTLFRKVPIAWNILQNQGDGTLDTAMQEVVGFFDACDTLLVLGRPLVPDLRVWLAQILEALAAGAPEVALAPPEAPPVPTLRLVTRDAIGRYRELLNHYSLQVLRANAAGAGQSTINILQNLRLPRTKTDKLFALLEEDRKRAGGGTG